MSVGRNSRNNYTAIIRVVNSEGESVEPDHLDIRPRLRLARAADDMVVIPSADDNWSRIAWRTLGDGRMWWIIADMSGVIDPLSELQRPITPLYVSELAESVAAGRLTSLRVKHPRAIRRGFRIRVEDMTAGVSVDTTVIGMSSSSGILHVEAVDSPALDAETSRVLHLVQPTQGLVVPSASRAVFEAMNFGNPLNVLVD